MLATIWMCTQEWSLIWRRTTAFTLETCHQPFKHAVGVGALEDAAELAVPAVGKPDPHVLDRFRGREASLANGVRGDGLLDARLGLGVERHVSTGSAATACASRRRK